MLVKENNWAVSITGKLVIQMKRIQNGVQSVENYIKELPRIEPTHHNKYWYKFVDLYLIYPDGVTYDKNKSPPPSMGWITEIYAHLRAVYEIEANLLNEIKQTNNLLTKLLGVEGHVPTQELNDRAAIIGALINRLINEEGRP